MSEQLAGHDDGTTEDGVMRLRRPPDWWRSVGGSGVEAIVWLLPQIAPAIGGEVDIDGTRYRVLNVRSLNLKPAIDPQTRAFELDLDEVGPSPHDPLVPRARAIVAHYGGTVERLSAKREGSVRHVSIHAEATWPGRTADVYGTGGSDHEALADLEEHMAGIPPVTVWPGSHR